MTDDVVIQVNNVSKKFKSQVVLKDITLQCRKGRIYGFVGYNGSGKTVLFKCICGLLYVDAGEIRVNGEKIDISKYNEIYIGFPIWWYVEPKIIDTFLDSYDFAGKTVIPFATSGGSGIENVEKNLQKEYPNINWGKGKLLNGSVKAWF